MSIVSLRNLLVLLSLACLTAASACAGSLSAMRFSDGWYMYAGGDTAVASLRLPHRTVSRLELSQKIAFVDANDGNYLYGAGQDRIVSLRLNHSHISSIQLGDDIAVVTSGGRTYLYGLARDAFHGSLAPHANPSQVKISGRLVLLGRAGSWAVAGAGPEGLLTAHINGRPSNIQVNRDTAVLQYSGGGTWVVSLGAAGFSSLQASPGHPSTVVLGNAPEAQSRFETLHADAPAE